MHHSQQHLRLVPPRLDEMRAARYGTAMEPPPPHVKEDYQRTRRDIRAAIIFGIVAATLELAAVLWFFR